MTLNQIETRIPADGEKGHIWCKDSKGEIETFEASEEAGDHHYGPLCSVCAYWYCVACHDEPQDECDLD